MGKLLPPKILKEGYRGKTYWVMRNHRGLVIKRYPYTKEGYNLAQKEAGQFKRAAEVPRKKVNMNEVLAGKPKKGYEEQFYD